MEICIFSSTNELNKAATDFISKAVTQKPEVVLGLATGSTPLGIYQELAKRYLEGRISFHRCSCFNLDEYIGLPQNHPQSYAYYMWTHFYQHVDVPAEQRYIPHLTRKEALSYMKENIEPLNESTDEASTHTLDALLLSQAQIECNRYDALLNEKGPIDIQLLGLGHNGHIGFNEPGEALYSQTHVVQLHQQTRQANARFFSSIQEVPSHAITMGLGAIMKSKVILLVVSGSSKADMIKRALKGPITTQVPASLLQTHPNLIVMLDQEAGEELMKNDNIKAD